MSRDYILHPFRQAMELQIDYARELNEQQFAAVTAPPGPSLVIAGAGSGKTRTLTYRVAFLLEQGIPPERILLLTFTNKAAREMMRRVSDLLGNELASLWGGTFHSIGNRVLRKHAPLLGYQRDFTILDREDAKQVIATCIAESEIDVKKTRFPKADVLGDIFSMAVNTRETVLELVQREHGHFEELTDQIVRMHEKYGERKRAANAMDFDDLLVLWLRLLQEHEEVRDLYQRRFQFVLVDEYQDTNRLQSDLIDLLGERHHNIMVVGDDAQSIYSWRGANFANILKFPERHPNSKIYKIETNYRSTPEILQVANAAILPNVNQFEKLLASSRKPGQKPALVVCHDSSEQATFVAQRVLQLREEGIELNRMVVLYRSHFHSLELQFELTRRNIPFSITSGMRFFEQAHVKDVAAYLRFIINPRDELSLKRVAQLFRGIGAKAADKLWKKFSELWANADPAPSGSAEKSGLAATLQACADAVPRKAAVDWAQFVATVSQLDAEGTRSNASEMVLLTVEAGYEDYLHANYTNAASRLEDLEQLAVFARQFESVEEFLTQLALMTNVEAEEDQPASRDDERLRLSTVHQAKGLEFDVVFVIMLCDGLFPSRRSLESPDGEEEERRLFYVAITRAKDELYLSYPLMRATPDSDGTFMKRPSRFLQEIPRELIEEWNLRSYGME